MSTLHKKLINSAILLTAFVSHAQADDCFDVAMKHGTSAKYQLSQQCKEKAENQANISQKRIDPSGMWISIGYANVLLARKMDLQSESLITGEHSGLQTIAATMIDVDHQEIYAYDSATNSVSNFDLNLSGNVGPKRILKLKDTGKVIGIAIDAKNNFLFVAHENSISVYRREASSSGRKPENNVSEVTRIELPHPLSNIAFDSTSGFLYQVDQKNQKKTIATYDEATSRFSIK